MSEAAEMAEWGVEFAKPKISIDKVRARKEHVIDTLIGGLRLWRNGRRNLTCRHPPTGSQPHASNSTMTVDPALRHVLARGSVGRLACSNRQEIACVSI
jgi:hypothetical protein